MDQGSALWHFCREVQVDPHEARPSAIPSARQTSRRRLQPRLPVLFLPVEGEPVSGARNSADERQPAGDLYPAVHAVVARTAGGCRLAGWRTDAARARLLPPLG